MGKIILEFDSIEEQDDAKIALDGYKWKMVIWELDQLLRNTTKHAVFEKRQATAAEQDMADKLRDIIRELLDEHNLNLEN